MRRQLQNKIIACRVRTPSGASARAAPTSAMCVTPRTSPVHRPRPHTWVTSSGYSGGARSATSSSYRRRSVDASADSRGPRGFSALRSASSCGGCVMSARLRPSAPSCRIAPPWVWGKGLGRAGGGGQARVGLRGEAWHAFVSTARRAAGGRQAGCPGVSHPSSAHRQQPVAAVVAVRAQGLGADRGTPLLRERRRARAAVKVVIAVVVGPAATARRRRERRRLPLRLSGLRRGGGRRGRRGLGGRLGALAAAARALRGRPAVAAAVLLLLHAAARRRGRRGRLGARRRGGCICGLLARALRLAPQPRRLALRLAPLRVGVVLADGLLDDGLEPGCFLGGGDWGVKFCVGVSQVPALQAGRKDAPG
jgi:hypothetical protein